MVYHGEISQYILSWYNPVLQGYLLEKINIIHFFTNDKCLWYFFYQWSRQQCKSQRNSSLPTDYNPCEGHGPVHDGVERRIAHDMSGWEERALDPAGRVEQTWGEDPEGKVPVYMVAGQGLDGHMCICGCARVCMLVSQVYVK